MGFMFKFSEFRKRNFIIATAFHDGVNNMYFDSYTINGRFPIVVSMFF